MKVFDSSPIVFFKDGEALVPEDVNRMFLYKQDALADVSEKRFSIVPLTFSFGDDVNLGINNTSALGKRQVRFRCPFPCTIVRAFLNGKVATGVNQPMNLTISDLATSIAPDGAVTPYMSLPGGLSLTDEEDHTDINVNKVQLNPGINYGLLLAGTSFTTGRLDLTLHVLVDRFFLTGNLFQPAFRFKQLTDADTADGDDLDGVFGDFSYNSDLLTQTSGHGCFLMQVNNFDSSTIAAKLQKLFGALISPRAQMRVERIFFTSSVSSSASGRTVTMELVDSAGVTQSKVVNAHTTQTIVTGDSGALNLPVSGNSNVVTDDWMIRFSTNTPSPAQVYRGMALVWVEWR